MEGYFSLIEGYRLNNSGLIWLFCSAVILKPMPLLFFCSAIAKAPLPFSAGLRMMHHHTLAPSKRIKKKKKEYTSIPLSLVKTWLKLLRHGSTKIIQLKQEFFPLSCNSSRHVGRLCSIGWSRDLGWWSAPPSLAHGFHSWV